MTRTNQAPSPVIDLPDGFDVVGLPTLLDTGLMLERLDSCLPHEMSRIDCCRIVNLRRKTQTSCTVCYELTRRYDGGPSTEFAYVRAFSKLEFCDAERRAHQSRWATTADGLSITTLHDLNAIVYWFPNDERLDGLRRVMIPKKLQRLFYAHFSEYSSTKWRISDRSIRLQTLRYKPERRAVLKCRFRVQRKDETDRRERFVYLGLYERERVPELAHTAARMRHLAESASTWTTARLLAVDEADALLIWDELPGSTLRTELSRRFSTDDLARCARAIADMHTCEGSSLPPRDAISVQIEATRSFLAIILPERITLIDDLAKRLESRLARTDHGRSQLVHGDLHPGQIILTEGRLGVIDLDRVHAGDPLEDVGNLRAQLWLGPHDGMHYDPEKAFAAFLQEYARLRTVTPLQLDTWTALSLYRSAVVPLGRFQSDWRNRAYAILQEADRFLS